MEMQRTLDEFVVHARRVLNDLMERGELDMRTVVAKVGERQRKRAMEHVPAKMLLMDFFRERAEIRKYGRAEDSKERYDRFLRWFEKWGVMQTFDDVTEANVLKMDEALSAKKLKACTKWNNYHRFLNSFILDAMDEGLIRRNPYKRVHIDKDKESRSLMKYLTRSELMRIETLELPTAYLCHARDLFVFQTYTCLSYIDMRSFDAKKVFEVNGRKMYRGQRGKTRQEFTFVLLKPALDILSHYNGALPMMSNEKYNEYLKAIAMMAGINKPVSSHWARHTGATLLLNAGVNMEVVSKVLGHSSPRITRSTYAKLLDETVSDAFARFEQTL